MKHDILGESSFGMLATFGDPLGREGSWEVGGDFTYQTSRFRGTKNFSVGAWAIATGRDDLDTRRERTALGISVDYPNDLWDCFANYRRIGDGFDPSLGFVARSSVTEWVGGCTLAPRPRRGFARQLFFEFYPGLVTDLNGRWERYEFFTAPLNVLFESGDRVNLTAHYVGERLAQPFEILNGLVVPAGSYDWRRYKMELLAAGKRGLSGRAAWSFGGFYGGKLDQIHLEAAWTPAPLVTLLLSAEHDIARLEPGDFDLTVAGLKIRLNLSPDLQLTSFLQYDSVNQAFGTNLRVRYTFHARGDLFVIYNHNLRELDNRWRAESRELLVKLQYTFRR